MPKYWQRDKSIEGGGRWICYIKKRLREQRAEERRREDPEKLSAYRLAQRKRSIKRDYGLDFEEAERLHAFQEGKCAICGAALKLINSDAVGKIAAIDHNHKTGEIRGLLCAMPCNHILGHWRDNAERMRAAAEYLTDPPAFRVLGKRQVPKKPRRRKKQVVHQTERGNDGRADARGNDGAGDGPRSTL